MNRSSKAKIEGKPSEDQWFILGDTHHLTNKIDEEYRLTCFGHLGNVEDCVRSALRPGFPLALLEHACRAVRTLCF